MIGNPQGRSLNGFVNPASTIRLARVTENRVVLAIRMTRCGIATKGKKVLTMTPDIWRMLFFILLGIVLGNLFERWRFK